MTPIDTTQVWVVSLKSATTRREAFRSTVPDGFPRWAFFDACDGIATGLSYDADHVRAINNRPLQPGELGCYSSHYQLWSWLADHPDCKQMVVIEDDVVMDWRFLAAIAEHDFTAQGIEYLRLFAKMPAPWRFIASPFFDKYRHLIQFTGYPLGTQAYLVTRAGAAKFRDHGRAIEAAVDVYMDRTWVHRVPNLAIFPFPAYERHQSSSIGEARFDAPARRLQDSLIALPPKIMRRIHGLWLRCGWPDAAARRLRRQLAQAPK